MMCRLLTQMQCAHENGVWLGVGSHCETHSCAPPPTVTGACCVVSAGGEVHCIITTQQHCHDEGGVWRGTGSNCKISPCHPGDNDGDGHCGLSDLLNVLSGWGACPPRNAAPCTADMDGDATVGVSDLLIVLANWD